MEQLLAGIEAQGIAAHSPIEQRWSASSSSFMSPAYDPNPEGLHCWVGIIMYLPDADNIPQRTAITNAFNGKYCDLMRHTGQKVNAASHWAKLELPATEQATKELQQHMRERYPVNYYNHARYTFDPTNLMSNDLINAAFGDPADSETLGSIANKPRL
jgi:L-galactono-1,4-lactone dehydrogenase